MTRRANPLSVFPRKDGPKCVARYTDVGEIGGARGWAVEFSADAIGEPGSDTALLSWYANPLLYPFVRAAGEI
jgi:hypothetical protein